MGDWSILAIDAKGNLHQWH